MRAARRALGYALAATALVACPCHLALTLPLALAVLGGTALGATLAAHTGLLVAAAAAYFVAALAAAVYLLNRPSRERPMGSGDEAGAHAHTPSHTARKPRSGVDR